MMDDDLRTAIQDYLEDFCDTPQTASEVLAEGLGDYLGERGWGIVDQLGNKVS